VRVFSPPPVILKGGGMVFFPSIIPSFLFLSLPRYFFFSFPSNITLAAQPMSPPQAPCRPLSYSPSFLHSSPAGFFKAKYVILHQPLPSNTPPHRAPKPPCVPLLSSALPSALHASAHRFHLQVSASVPGLNGSQLLRPPLLL
jgi:hypothetical protein